MSEEKILVPVTHTLEAREIQAEGLDTAYALCGPYARLLSMRELVYARIHSSTNKRIWQQNYVCPSIFATGRTEQGAIVAVVAHCDNYLSNPAAIEEAKQKLVGSIDGVDMGMGGAVSIPQKEFYRLLDLKDDENVFILSYTELINAYYEGMPIGEALDHPLVIPFLGGRDMAERYLEIQKEHHGMFDPKVILVHYPYGPIGQLEEEPKACLLGIGAYNTPTIDATIEPFRGMHSFLAVNRVITLEDAISLAEEYSGGDSLTGITYGIFIAGLKALPSK